MTESIQELQNKIRLAKEEEHYKCVKEFEEYVKGLEGKYFLANNGTNLQEDVAKRKSTFIWACYIHKFRDISTWGTLGGGGSVHYDESPWKNLKANVEIEVLYFNKDIYHYSYTSQKKKIFHNTDSIEAKITFNVDNFDYDWFRRQCRTEITQEAYESFKNKLNTFIETDIDF